MHARTQFKVLFPAFCLLLLDCLTFDTLQSAKLLSKGDISVVPKYSLVTYTHTGAPGIESDNFGLLCGVGLTPRFNVYAKYDRLQLYAYDVGYNFLDVEPKFAILKDRIALSLPVGFYFGKDIEYDRSLDIQPTLFLTYTFNRVLDCTIAPKVVVFVPSFTSVTLITLVSANMGIHCLSDKIVIVPELGYAAKPWAMDRFFYGSIGIAYRIHLVR